MKSTEDLANDLFEILFKSKVKERSITFFILSTDRKERMAIRKKFNELTEMELTEEIKKKFSGDFRDLCAKLFLTREEFDAQEIIRAFDRFSTDEDTIYEIIFNRPNKLKQKIIEEFKKETGQDLINQIHTKFHKYTKEPFTKLIGMERFEGKRLDKNKCLEAANKFANISPDEWVKDDSILSYFGLMTAAELLYTGRAYLEIKNQNILDAINTISSKHVQVLLRNLYYNVVNPAELYAKKINDSVSGLGTDENLLDRMIVTRHDVDINLIKKYYIQNYNETLKQAIENDCSGSYKRLLIGLAHQYDICEY